MEIDLPFSADGAFGTDRVFARGRIVHDGVSKCATISFQQKYVDDLKLSNEVLKDLVRRSLVHEFSAGRWYEQFTDVPLGPFQIREPIHVEA